ncbi:hypothetical protein L7F22_053717 [Adiantum nelumboides]|nr:hypothetical protein [Adiantum nelumboides]
MAPTPPLPFEQALALLHSGQHRRFSDQASQTTRSAHTQQFSRTEPSAPILSYQDALAILQRGEHRRHSPSPLSHQASTHASSSARSSHIDQISAPIVPFQQALAMLQRGEHHPNQQVTPSVPHQTVVPAGTFSASRNRLQQPIPSNATIQPAGMSGLHNPQSMGPVRPMPHLQELLTLLREDNQSNPQSIGSVSSMPTFQDIVATLHRGNSQSSAAEAVIYNARARLQRINSRSSQETHSEAWQPVRSSGERPRPVSTTSTHAHRSPSSSTSSLSHHDHNARHGQRTLQQAAISNAHLSEGNGTNGTYNTNVGGGQVIPVDSFPHLVGECRLETQPHMMLANLPSLSFVEACDIINWRSATKYEIMNCGICLDDFEREDEVHLFPNCSHLFHVVCVKDWLLRVGSCPCCRDIIISIKEPAQQ